MEVWIQKLIKNEGHNIDKSIYFCNVYAWASNTSNKWFKKLSGNGYNNIRSWLFLVC